MAKKVKIVTTVSRCKDNKLSATSYVDGHQKKYSNLEKADYFAKRSRNGSLTEGQREYAAQRLSELQKERKTSAPVKQLAQKKPIAKRLPAKKVVSRSYSKPAHKDTISKKYDVCIRTSKPKPKATTPKLLQKDENGLSAIDYWSDYSGYLSHDTYAEVESTPKKDLRAALPFVKDSTLKYAINYYLNGEKLF